MKTEKKFYFTFVSDIHIGLRETTMKYLELLGLISIFYSHVEKI